MTLFDKITHCYENMTPFQTAMALSVICLYFLYLFMSDMGIPPGPKGLPIIGYWPFLKPDTSHLQLQKLSRKYGDVFSYRVCGTLLIHLGSIKSIKEAHITKSEYFAGRFGDASILYFLFKDGLAFENGETWKVLRKFFVAKFKEFGMNAVKENTANAIYDSLKDAVEEMHKTKGRPMKITDMITRKCMLIFRRILFNDQHITIEEFKELIDRYAELVILLSSTNMMLIGNFAKYFMQPFMPSMWKMRKYNERIEAILFDVVNRHKSEYNESNVTDLVDCYFKERDERLKKGDPTARYLTDKALVSSLSQFATDGVLTLGVFIGNFLMTLVKHPEEQDKIYEEIRDVIGTERLPTIEDKSKMPYTTAFIYEFTRFTDFFPLFPSMECSKETTVSGYRIPKGSITLLNLYCAHRNSDYFENPDEFNPSRYLPGPGKQRPDLPVLFGVGKRSCIGEGFSMIQTFLFLTTIVQNFHLTIPESSKGSTVLFWSEEKLEICAIPRYEKSDSKST